MREKEDTYVGERGYRCGGERHTQERDRGGREKDKRRFRVGERKIGRETGGGTERERERKKDKKRAETGAGERKKERERDREKNRREREWERER